jgi:hypothetical protein
MELEELERKYKESERTLRELGEEIERIKSKPEEVWAVETTQYDSNVACEAYKPQTNTEAYIRQSNAFSTELEAARMAERLNLELEISKFIKDNHGEVNWDYSSECKYSIRYNYGHDVFSLDINYELQNIGLPYFNSRQLAEQAIEIYGNRLKFAWGITDER